MNFNSFQYGIFFILVFVFYVSIKFKWQNRLLLIASYVFYSFWDWRFLGLIFISTLTDYLCALKISESKSLTIRKRYLSISIVTNLSILAFFKYFNFFLDNLISLVSLSGVQLSAPTLNIILPVGISFYTFQTMSYTIDVYRKQLHPTRDFFNYALYVSFFPQLVAGPIERAKNLLPQIERPRSIDFDTISEGLLLIYWGLFKKIFIADNMGTFLQLAGSAISADGSTGDGGLILTSTYAFMFQLYCDFSAYSDIARGSAKLLGFDIMVNFRAPLFSRNIQELWNRWHISLTSWIRDYLYYPLATTKFFHRNLNVNVVVILTFLIMGLWHGASWNYVVWGGYNGLILVLYTIFVRKTKKFRKRKSPLVSNIIHLFSIFITFHAAAFGVLFFRATSMHQIIWWVYHLFASFSFSPVAIDMLLKVIIYVSPLLVVDLFLFKKDELNQLFRYPILVRYGFLYITFFLMVVFRAHSSNFIYFQF